MKNKPLPIGIDNFEEIIMRDAYYVDKTKLIEKLIDSATKVALFTRPRRFGKSLNLSMIQYYFESNEEDKSHLFEGLYVSKLGDSYKQEMGAYPVIMLNFKEGKQRDFETSHYFLVQNIIREYRRHGDILTSEKLTKEEEQQYQRIQEDKADNQELIGAIEFLSKCLEKVHNKKVIILIDEYDVPLENAYFRGFYDEMIGFVRGLLSIALKTNNSLYFAVMTGCLRITKESIFTGLNNLEIISIDSKEYGEYFGFTQEEVQQMLEYYGKSEHFQIIKEWYDGYCFGETEVYNPWSLINYMKSILANDKEYPKPYWSNTSSNSVVKSLIEKADASVKTDIERLLGGATIYEQIREDITYEDVYKSPANLWNFLYYTGYLKKVDETLEDETIYATLKIPNKEIRYIYKNCVMEWVEDRVENINASELFKATVEEDIALMKEEINHSLEGMISFYDNNESFFHGFMIGLYRNIPNYTLNSNIEVGNGRPDVVLMHNRIGGKHIIMEFKHAREPLDFAGALVDAVNQIKEKRYIEGLKAKGYENVIAYGIAFCRKECRIERLN